MRGLQVGQCSYFSHVSTALVVVSPNIVLCEETVVELLRAQGVTHEALRTSAVCFSPPLVSVRMHG